MMDSPRTPDLTLSPALSRHTRPRRPSALSCSLTFFWRVMLKIKHIPEQMFDVVAYPVMFLVLFTYIFGGAIAGSTTEYLQFILPGILAINVIFITIYTGLGILNDIKKGVFDRFRSLPIWQPSFLVGALLGDTVRYAVASILVILLGLAMGFRPDGGTLGVVWATLLLLAFSFCLSWAWISLGLVMRTPESLMAMSMVILFPLSFLTNVLVPVETMPGWLQALVNVNPITHLVAAMRELMFAEPLSASIGWVALSCALLLLVFGPLSVRLYRRKR